MQRFAAVQTTIFVLRHHIAKGKAQIIRRCPQNQTGKSAVLRCSDNGSGTAKAASQKEQLAAGLSAAYLSQYGAQLLHLTRNYLRTCKVEAHHGSMRSSLMRHACSTSAAVAAAAEAVRHNKNSIIITAVRLNKTFNLA